MLRFNDILDRILEYDPQADVQLLQRAYVYSAKVHEGQERLSGEPYLVHPLEVAGILTEMRLDAVTLSAGLLHDTLEDTLSTPEELERLFGRDVGFLVEGLTKIAKIEFKSVRERQAENFRKMLLAMSKDIRILLIKLADRLHNMRTLRYMSEDAARRVAEETQEIYVPLAHRLGIHWMKQELEDLAFRALHPQVAEDLERQLTLSRKEREEYIEEVIGVLSARLVDVGVQAEIAGRVKDLASIHHKMKAQSVTLDQIYDVIAFRMVVQGPQALVYTALGVVHDLWRPVPGRFKDWVALPKSNGYQSLHTTVIGPYGERMEMQIRTQEMHSQAEFGIAAHWKYKAGQISGDSEDEQRFAWLRQLLEWQRDLQDPHEFLDTVKVDLFPDDVFVFTPRGDVITLPRNATPVDFAYAIHTEVGAHCAGSRVNGRQVPLRHVLQNGDTVEIQTSKSQHPRKDWLDFAASGKARSKIRHSIRAAEQERSRELGRQILERELRRAGLNLSKLLSDGEIEKAARAEARGSVDELFSRIGYGRVPAAQVVQRLDPQAQPEPAPKPRRRSFFRREPKQPATGGGLRVSGMGDVLVRFARCCSPIPGDEVIGFITRGRGVTVHVKDCNKVFELDPERRVEVEWESDAAHARRIKMRVHSLDKPGLLAVVTNTISEAGINIEGARVTTTRDQKALQTFDLAVSDLATLKAVMKQIGRIKGVLSVERLRS